MEGGGGETAHGEDKSRIGNPVGRIQVLRDPWVTVEKYRNHCTSPLMSLATDNQYFTHRGYHNWSDETESSRRRQ